tara:strand:+ start:874 stop:1248 length:375 start_codon:yes stop_codon:yes gene_type:complete
MNARIRNVVNYGVYSPLLQLVEKEYLREIDETRIEEKDIVIAERDLMFLFIMLMVSKMKEVFTAKNGRPYIKDDSGKVRFISDAEAEQYLMQEDANKNGKVFITVTFIVVAVIIAASDYGMGLI